MSGTTIRIRIEGPDNEAEVAMSAWGSGNYWEVEETIEDALIPAVMRAYFGYSLEDELEDDEEPYEDNPIEVKLQPPTAESCGGLSGVYDDDLPF